MAMEQVEWSGLEWSGLDWTGLDWTVHVTEFLRRWTVSVDSPSAWIVQSNLTQTKARRKKIGSEKELHQKNDAQLMSMF